MAKTKVELFSLKLHLSPIWTYPWEPWCISSCLSQWWKQTGMIHSTPIWSCGMNPFTWEGGELKLGLLQSQVGITQTPAMNHASGEPHGNSTFPTEMRLFAFSLSDQKVQNLYLKFLLHAFPIFFLPFFFLSGIPPIEKKPQSETSIHS